MKLESLWTIPIRRRFQILYDEVHSACKIKRNVLKDFQMYLRSIKEWDEAHLQQEFQYLTDICSVKGEVLQKLIQVIGKHIHEESCIQHLDYIHRLYLNIARKLWKNPYLVYDINTDKRKKVASIEKMDFLVAQSIRETFLEMIPIASMLSPSHGPSESTHIHKNSDECIDDDVSNNSEDGHNGIDHEGGDDEDGDEEEERDDENGDDEGDEGEGDDEGSEECDEGDQESDEEEDEEEDEDEESSEDYDEGIYKGTIVENYENSSSEDEDDTSLIRDDQISLQHNDVCESNSDEDEVDDHHEQEHHDSDDDHDIDVSEEAERELFEEEKKEINNIKVVNIGFDTPPSYHKKVSSIASKPPHVHLKRDSFF